MLHTNWIAMILSCALHVITLTKAFVLPHSTLCNEKALNMKSQRRYIENMRDTFPRLRADAHSKYLSLGTSLNGDLSGTENIDGKSDANNHSGEIDEAFGIINRRQVILSTVAAGLLTINALTTAPQNSNALESATISKAPSLEDLNLGEGKWTHISDATTAKAARAGTFTMAKSIIPPSFATYAARFLINYDEGVNQWWRDVKVSNSLLPSDEERSRLGSKFGDLSRSIQISLEHYILHLDDSATTINLKDTVAVKRRFEDLYEIFFSSYTNNSFIGDRDDESKRQLKLLFTTLPPKYQPVNGLRGNKIQNKGTTEYPAEDSPTTTPKISVAFTEELEYLLPSTYTSEFDSESKTFRIQPPVALYEIGIDNEFGQNAIATVFGPLSSKMLKRDKPDLSVGIYSLLGINGALACALTHGAVIPFDVVKTRLQTDPDRYSGLIDGTLTIAKSEGLQGFTLGAQATLSGYLYYGLSVYPSYSFSKWFLGHSILSPAYATAHADGIALVAGAIAAVIASLGLTPLEACRIRTVAEPEVYRDIGLMGTLKVISKEDETLGWKSLYAGLPALMTRQVIFGSVKFLAFERACEALFQAWPFLRDSSATALGVTLVAGALSGALSSVVSQPADSVLTYIAKNNASESEKGSSLVSSVQTMVENEGAGSLFRGLGGRCLWASAIISGQFVLYDIFRSALGINTEDLSQVFEFVIKSSNSIN